MLDVSKMSTVTGIGMLGLAILATVTASGCSTSPRCEQSHGVSQSSQLPSLLGAARLKSAACSSCRQCASRSSSLSTPIVLEHVLGSASLKYMALVTRIGGRTCETWASQACRSIEFPGQHLANCHCFGLAALLRVIGIRQNRAAILVTAVVSGVCRTAGSGKVGPRSS